MLVVAIVIFACLMATRGKFAAGWKRALVAGIAFGILARVVGQVRIRGL